MLTAEQKARLNPKQLIIAEKWDKEKEERDVLFDKIIAAQKDGNTELFLNLVDEMNETVPSQCEHERSIWSPCMACNEIERLLNPEFYDSEGERLPEEEIEKLFNERDR